MAEITNEFARFILECQATYEDLCKRIENGEVPAGTKATLTIEVLPEAIDAIRRERLAIMAAETNGHG